VSAERIGLLVHLLGSFAFVGGIITAGSAFEVARRRRSAVEIAAVLKVSRVGAIVALFGGVVLLVGGFWLAGHLGVFRTRWLQASVLAFLLSFLLGIVGGRRPRKARELATSIASGGEGNVDEMRALLNDRAALFVNYLSAALALVVLVLMVWQPSF